MAQLEDSSHVQEPRCLFREMLRENDLLVRKGKRNADFAGRRGIDLGKHGGPKPTIADVEAIAKRLKKKAGGIESRHNDLNLLQAALTFSDERFWEAFLNVDGALPALVRDLSGQDSGLQLRATYCCANFALAGPDVGLKVAKAAAPYLVVHLKGMNQVLLEASLWAVGSLSGSGILAYQVLEVQGVYPQIINIMQRYHPSVSIDSPLQENSNKLQEIRVIEAVLYAAAHCISIGLPTHIGSSRVEEMTAAAIPLLDRLNSNFLPRLIYLFFVLSCSESSETIFLESEVVSKFILLLDEIRAMVSDNNASSSSSGFPIQVLTCIIRTFGNISSTERGRLKFESVSEIMCPILNDIMKAFPYLPMYLLKETLWFVMNLLRPYSLWRNKVLVVNQCPWSSIAHMVNICFELQAKRMKLGASVIPAGTDLQ